MLEALIEGQATPEEMAELAKGGLREKTGIVGTSIGRTGQASSSLCADRIVVPDRQPG